MILMSNLMGCLMKRVSEGWVFFLMITVNMHVLTCQTDSRRSPSVQGLAEEGGDPVGTQGKHQGSVQELLASHLEPCARV